MSLVYNNDKPIGKCESYSIDKVSGTSPFVMLTNYEPLRSELNKNQQIVLEWLKSNSNALKVPMLAIYELAELADEKVRAAYRQLNREEEFQVLAAFAEWGMKQ